MTRQIVAQELPFVASHPLVGIPDNRGVLTSQRTDHLLFADKEMGAMVMQAVDGGEWALTVGNEHIGRDGIVL